MLDDDLNKKAYMTDLMIIQTIDERLVSNAAFRRAFILTAIEEYNGNSIEAGCSDLTGVKHLLRAVERYQQDDKSVTHRD